MNTRYTALLVAGLIASACAAESDQQQGTDTAGADTTAPMVDTAADEAALEQLRADYVAHYNQHHASIVADMYTDSAFDLQSDGTVAEGKAEILAGLEQAMTESPTLALETGDVMVLGEHAVARGSWNVSFTPQGGSLTTLAGNYLTHFVKADGQWKINGVITNLNAPPPEGAPMSDLSTEDAPPDEGTMDALRTAWSQHFAAGDWAALAGLYTPDAVVGFSEAPPLEGTAAIQARFQENFGPSTERQIEIHDVGTLELGGGWALDGGWFTVNATTPEGRITHSGTYMNLLRQQPDGSWKIHWGLSNGHAKPVA